MINQRGGFLSTGSGSRGAGRVLCLLFVALLFSIIFPFHQASAQYRFDHWTTDNGLPQNTIRGIVQTRAGYLWFTTFDGLVRFDGARFTVFHKGNTPGIVNNRFIGIIEDRQGTLYAAIEGGGVTVYRNGVFTSYTQAEGFPGADIFDLKLDRNGEMLIKVWDGNSVYLRDGKFIPAPPEYQTTPQASFYASPTGRFWTIDRSGVYLREGERAIHFPIAFESTDMETVQLYEDRAGGLWVADGTAALYSLRDGLITRYAGKGALPPRKIVRSLCEDRDGGIWFVIGSHRAPDCELVRFKDGRFTLFGDKSGMPKTDIGQILADREGAVWIGAATGLYRASKQTVTAYSTGHGLAGKEVYPLLETRGGDILVGATAGISLLRDERFTTILPVTDFAFPQALWEDERGRLWIGRIGGMDWFENGKLTEAYPGRLDTICVIRPDREGNVWVASELQGLFKFNGDEIVAHYTAADGLPSNDVRVIHQSPDGSLWFGTYGGLVRLKDNRFTAWTTKDGLASDRVRSIHEDASGTLWIGTYDGGLSRFRDGKFFNFTIDNGLFSNGVFAILEDRRGNFWMTSNRGIYRASRNDLNGFADGRLAEIHCVAYGKQDGMLNTECNGGRQPAGIIARDGKLWFPTMDGVVVIDPEAVASNPLPPPVVIEAIAVDRNNVALTNSVEVGPWQTSLDITYTALSLSKSELIGFKYKMEGLDKDWVDAGTRRTAYYSYLPPGEYTFRVIAANADGVWNMEGSAVKVIVIPPFYRRWWFTAVAVIAILGSAVSIYRYRVSQLKRERAAQQAFSRQLLESQERERRRIATELHDSLGQNLLIIKNWALIGLNMLKPDNPARETLGEISETSQLAIEEVRQIAHNLRPYQLERFGLTKTLEYMMSQVASSSDIEFTKEIDDLDGMLSKESEINFYRIVQECINNVVKHSEATRCHLSIKRTASGAEITCRDDGKGFDFDAVADPQKSGLGLTGLTERVRILGGALLVESAPGEGTQVFITIDRARGQQ